MSRRTKPATEDRLDSDRPAFLSACKDRELATRFGELVLAREDGRDRAVGEDAGNRLGEQSATPPKHGVALAAHDLEVVKYLPS